MNISTREPLAIKHLNQEHDHVLEMCSRIRKGLNCDVETQRIRNYTEWFREHYLEPHFEIEEDLLFPLLGSNARVKRALANHRRINRLLNCSCEDLKVLNLLEEELSTHVRFEERVLYAEIKSVICPEKLQEIEKHYQKIPFNDAKWEDRFWMCKNRNS